MDSQAADPRVDLAVDRTAMAKFRTELALDRTTLAWIRTTLSCRHSARANRAAAWY